MKYMIDTDICTYIIKKRPQQVLKKFKLLSSAEVGVSSITLSELDYGVAKSKHNEKNRKVLQAFLTPLEVFSYDDMAAYCYGDIRINLEKNGTPFGAMDLMIAAHAKSLGATLVTNNMKEYSRVTDLKIENWI